MKKWLFAITLIPIISYSITGCGTSPTPKVSTNKIGNHLSSPELSPSKGSSHITEAVKISGILIEKMKSLPQAIMGNALAYNKQIGLVSVGGYTGYQSLASTYNLTANRTFASMPMPSHDTASGFIGNTLYVVGGGQVNSYNTILALTTSGSHLAGTLPHPLSDATAAQINWHGNSALLLIGGYDGQTFRQKATLLAENNGKVHLQSVFTMPSETRYTAVAAASNLVYVLGGKTATGKLSKAVYVVTLPTSHAGNLNEISLRNLPSLPYGVQKAASFVAGNTLFCVGGLNSSGAAVDTVLALTMSSSTLRWRVIGHLPIALGDMGYAQVASSLFLAGGETRSGTASQLVFRISVQTDK